MSQENEFDKVEGPSSTVLPEQMYPSPQPQAEPVEKISLGKMLEVYLPQEKIDELATLAEISDGKTISEMVNQFINDGIYREANSISQGDGDIKDALVIHLKDKLRLGKMFPNGFVSGKELVDHLQFLLGFLVRPGHPEDFEPALVTVTEKEMMTAVEQAKVWGSGYTPKEVFVGHFHECVKEEGAFKKSVIRHKE